jgi:hypothetical protein
MIAPHSDPGPDSAPWRLPIWAWVLGLFLLFCALSPGRILAYDVALRAAVARALWAHGSVFVEPSSPLAEGLVKVPGKGATTFYGIGQSLAFIPFDFAGRVLAALPGLGPWAKAQLPAQAIVWLYIPLVGLWWWWSVVLLLREWGLTKRHALRAATLFLVSTVALAYCAQTAQEETLVGALVTGAAVQVMRWARSGRPSHALLAGLCAGLALMCRLNAVMAFPALLGLAIDQGRREKARLARWGSGLMLAGLGLLATLGTIAFFAAWRFHDPFSTGYDLARAQHLGVDWAAPRIWLAVALVFGPGKGLLVLSPPLLLSAVGLWRLRRSHPATVLGTVAGLAGASLLCSRILTNPDGSECWSVRYLVHWLGLLAYPAILAARAWAKRRPLRAAAGAVFAAGIAIQLLVFFAPDGVEYYQSDRDSHSRYALITGLADGQLGLRLRNAICWCLHRRLAGPPIAELAPMERNYIPNVWGYSYARKLHGSHPALAGLLLAAWIVQLCAACCLLGLALLPGQRPVRAAGAHTAEPALRPARAG